MAGFRLVEDFEASYIKFQGRAPRTLEELLVARADNEHKRRLAEVKLLAKKLALLDEFLPALAQLGAKLQYRSINSTDGGKTIRIWGPAHGPDNTLFNALVALRFKEIERRDSFRDEQTVTLQHGRWLRVEIDVRKPAVAAAA